MAQFPLPHHRPHAMPPTWDIFDVDFEKENKALGQELVRLGALLQLHPNKPEDFINSLNLSLLKTATAGGSAVVKDWEYTTQHGSLGELKITILTNKFTPP